MTEHPTDDLCNHYGRRRISSRQIDELIGLARGLCADGVLNDAEVSFLQKWLATNAAITEHAILAALYRRVDAVLHDGFVDVEEQRELFDALNAFSDTTFELGEVLKPATLPLCSPSPAVSFRGKSYCFTGSFNYGRRTECEEAVAHRGGTAGSLTQKTDFLVIGAYVTDSWKHSTFGHKIVKAASMRDEKGVPINIISEQHWSSFL